MKDETNYEVSISYGDEMDKREYHLILGSYVGFKAGGLDIVIDVRGTDHAGEKFAFSLSPRECRTFGSELLRMAQWGDNRAEHFKHP